MKKAITIFYYTVWCQMFRPVFNFIGNSFYNLFIRYNLVTRNALAIVYHKAITANTTADLAAVFNQVFAGYEQDVFKKDLDGLWSPSFSSVFVMRKAVCTGAAGLNFYLAQFYCKLLGISPVKKTIFGIWRIDSPEGHSMTLCQQENGTVLLLDYDRGILLPNLDAVKEYYRMNYEHGEGTMADYFIVEFPGVKSYMV